jgi:hypothetical protein
MDLFRTVHSHPIAMPSRAMYQMSAVIVEYREFGPPRVGQLTWTPFLWYTARKDSECSSYDSCSAEARHSTPNYQHRRGGSCPAKQRTKLEGTKEGEKCPLFPNQKQVQSKRSACHEPLCQSECISFPLEVKGPHLISCQHIGAYTLQNRIPSLPAKLIGTGIPTNIWK